MARAMGPHGEILSEVQEESVLKTFLERGMTAAVEQLAGDIAYGIIEIGGLHRVIEYQFEFKGGVLCDQTGQDVKNLVQPSEELIQKIGPENIPRLSEKYVNDFIAIKDAFEKGGANEVFHTSDEGGDQLVVYRYYRDGNAVKCSASFFHKNSTQLGKFSAALSQMSGLDFNSLAKDGSSPLIFSDRVATNELLDRAGASAGVHFNRDLSPAAVKEQMAKVIMERLEGCKSLQEVKDVLRDGANLSPRFLKENFGIEWNGSADGTLNGQYRALYHHLVEGAGSTANAPQHLYQLPMGVSVRSFEGSLQLPFHAEKGAGLDLSSANTFGASALPAGIGNLPALPQRLLQNHGFTSFKSLSSPTSTRSKFLFPSGEKNVSGSFPKGFRGISSPSVVKTQKRKKRVRTKSEVAQKSRDARDDLAEVRERIKKLFPLKSSETKQDKQDVTPKSVRTKHLFKKRDTEEALPHEEFEETLESSRSATEHDVTEHNESSPEQERGDLQIDDEHSVRYEMDEHGAVRARPIEDFSQEEEENVVDASPIEQEADDVTLEQERSIPALEDDIQLEEEFEATKDADFEADLESLQDEEVATYVGDEVESDIEDFEGEAEESVALEDGYGTEEFLVQEDYDGLSEEDVEAEATEESLEDDEYRLADVESEYELDEEFSEQDVELTLDSSYEQEDLAIKESDVEKLALDPRNLISEDELKDYLITGERGEVLLQMQDDVVMRDRLIALQMLREIALERELELLEFMMLQRRRKRRVVDLNYFLFRVIVDLELESELEEEILALLRFTQQDLELFARLARELSSDSRIEAALAYTQQ